MSNKSNLPLLITTHYGKIESFKVSYFIGNLNSKSLKSPMCSKSKIPRFLQFPADLKKQSPNLYECTSNRKMSSDFSRKPWYSDVYKRRFSSWIISGDVAWSWQLWQYQFHLLELLLLDFGEYLFGKRVLKCYREF